MINYTTSSEDRNINAYFVNNGLKKVPLPTMAQMMALKHQLNAASLSDLEKNIPPGRVHKHDEEYRKVLNQYICNQFQARVRGLVEAGTNAADAHSRKGVNECIQITIEDGLFTVKDFGDGIDVSTLPYLFVPGLSRNEKGIFGCNDPEIIGQFGQGFYSLLSFLLQQSPEQSEDSEFQYTDPYALIYKIDDKLYRVRFDQTEMSPEVSEKEEIVAVMDIPLEEPKITLVSKNQNGALKIKFKKYRGHEDILCTIKPAEREDHGTTLTIASPLIKKSMERVLITYFHGFERQPIAINGKIANDLSSYQALELSNGKFYFLITKSPEMDISPSFKIYNKGVLIEEYPLNAESTVLADACLCLNHLNLSHSRSHLNFDELLPVYTEIVKIIASHEGPVTEKAKIVNSLLKAFPKSDSRVTEVISLITDHFPIVLPDSSALKKAFRHRDDIFFLDEGLLKQLKGFSPIHNVGGVNLYSVENLEESAVKCTLNEVKHVFVNSKLIDAVDPLDQEYNVYFLEKWINLEKDVCTLTPGRFKEVENLSTEVDLKGKMDALNHRAASFIPNNLDLKEMHPVQFIPKVKCASGGFISENDRESLRMLVPDINQDPFVHKLCLIHALYSYSLYPNSWDREIINYINSFVTTYKDLFLDLYAEKELDDCLQGLSNESPYGSKNYYYKNDGRYPVTVLFNIFFASVTRNDIDVTTRNVLKILYFQLELPTQSERVKFITRMENLHLYLARNTGIKTQIKEELIYNYILNSCFLECFRKELDCKDSLAHALIDSYYSLFSRDVSQLPENFNSLLSLTKKLESGRNRALFGIPIDRMVYYDSLPKAHLNYMLDLQAGNYYLISRFLSSDVYYAPIEKHKVIQLNLLIEYFLKPEDPLFVEKGALFISLWELLIKINYLTKSATSSPSLIRLAENINYFCEENDTAQEELKKGIKNIEVIYTMVISRLTLMARNSAEIAKYQGNIDIYTAIEITAKEYLKQSPNSLFNPNKRINPSNDEDYIGDFKKLVVFFCDAFINAKITDRDAAFKTFLIELYTFLDKFGYLDEISNVLLSSILLDSDKIFRSIDFVLPPIDAMEQPLHEVGFVADWFQSSAIAERAIQSATKQDFRFSSAVRELIKNSIESGSPKIRCILDCNEESQTILYTQEDEGSGMTEEMVQAFCTPHKSRKELSQKAVSENFGWGAWMAIGLFDRVVVITGTGNNHVTEFEIKKSSEGFGYKKREVEGSLKGTRMTFEKKWGENFNFWGAILKTQLKMITENVKGIEVSINGSSEHQEPKKRVLQFTKVCQKSSGKDGEVVSAFITEGGGKIYCRGILIGPIPSEIYDYVPDRFLEVLKNNNWEINLELSKVKQVMDRTKLAVDHSVKAAMKQAVSRAVLRYIASLVQKGLYELPKDYYSDFRRCGIHREEEVLQLGNAIDEGDWNPLINSVSSGKDEWFLEAVEQFLESNKDTGLLVFNPLSRTYEAPAVYLGRLQTKTTAEKTLSTDIEVEKYLKSEKNCNALLASVRGDYESIPFLEYKKGVFEELLEMGLLTQKLPYLSFDYNDRYIQTLGVDKIKKIMRKLQQKLLDEAYENGLEMDDLIRKMCDLILNRLIVKCQGADPKYTGENDPTYPTIESFFTGLLRHFPLDTLPELMLYNNGNDGNNGYYLEGIIHLNMAAAPGVFRELLLDALNDSSLDAAQLIRDNMRRIIEGYGTFIHELAHFKLVESKDSHDHDEEFYQEMRDLMQYAFCKEGRKAFVQKLLDLLVNTTSQDPEEITRNCQIIQMGKTKSLHHRSKEEEVEEEEGRQPKRLAK